MFCCLYTAQETEKHTEKQAENESNESNNSIFIRNVSQKSMSVDRSKYHTIYHIIEVELFSKEVLQVLGYRVRSKTFQNMVYACRLHDVYHPASNLKEFIFDSKKYDILENMHSAVATYILKKTNIRDADSLELITTLILSTNLDSYNLDNNCEIDILKCVIRCSDLCHFTFELLSHIDHTKRLENEIGKSIPPQSNVRFIDLFVIPQFELLHSHLQCQSFQKYLENIQKNRNYWHTLALHGKTSVLMELI